MSRRWISTLATGRVVAWPFSKKACPQSQQEKPTDEVSKLETLPNELLLEIFQWIGIWDLKFRMALVNKRFLELVRWMEHSTHAFGLEGIDMNEFIRRNLKPVRGFLGDQMSGRSPGEKREYLINPLASALICRYTVGRHGRVRCWLGLDELEIPSPQASDGNLGGTNETVAAVSTSSNILTEAIVSPSAVIVQLHITEADKPVGRWWPGRQENLKNVKLTRPGYRPATVINIVTAIAEHLNEHRADTFRHYDCFRFDVDPDSFYRDVPGTLEIGVKVQRVNYKGFKAKLEQRRKELAEAEAGLQDKS